LRGGPWFGLGSCCRYSDNLITPKRKKESHGEKNGDTGPFQKRSAERKGLLGVGLLYCHGGTLSSADDKSNNRERENEVSPLLKWLKKISLVLLVSSCPGGGGADIKSQEGTR